MGENAETRFHESQGQRRWRHPMFRQTWHQASNNRASELSKEEMARQVPSGQGRVLTMLQGRSAKGGHAVMRSN
jgi:hypothetical protein